MRALLLGSMCPRAPWRSTCSILMKLYLPESASVIRGLKRYVAGKSTRPLCATSLAGTPPDPKMTLFKGPLDTYRSIGSRVSPWRDRSSWRAVRWPTLSAADSRPLDEVPSLDPSDAFSITGP
jgi:hypothetical protein